MDPDAIMTDFARLEYAMIDFGPKHPTNPVPELQREIDEFFSEYPILRRDKGYVAFLETYSAAAVFWPNQELVIQIYGFSEEMTEHLLYPDEPLLEQGRFLRFAEVMIEEEEDVVGLSFAWEVTGQHSPGVYRQLRQGGADWKTTPYTLYASTFLNWLEEIVTKNGRLY